MKKELEDKKEKSSSMKNKKLKKPLNLTVNFTIIAIILIAVYCVAVTPITFQNDTYYTIKIGELIKNNGIDMMDHFSWHKGLKYTYPHWLYDFCTYLVYSIGGFKGVYILTCVLSAILGISLFIVNTKITKSRVISFVITMLSIYVLRDYIAARAQLATFILFIWELYFIEKFIENKKIRYAIGLVIISILIANLHCAVWPFFFVIFLPYVAEYLIAVIADIVIYKKDAILVIKHKTKVAQKKNNLYKLKKLQVKLDERLAKNEKIKAKREDENNSYKLIIKRKENVKYLIIVMIICAFTGLLTPLKDTPYTYLYKTMKGNTTQNISEHQPMTLTDNKEAMCILIIFLAILIFTKVKIRLSDLFMIAGLCYLMLASRRQLSMFTLICSVILGKMIVQLIKTYTKDDILNQLETIFSDYRISIAITILVLLMSWYTIKDKKDDKFVNTKSYPVAASDFILENIDLSKARLYNEYNYGSYLLFRGIPVFIDSRADLYAPEFSGNKDEDIFTDFINTSSIGKFYEDTFEKYGITHAILKKNSKTNMIITKTHDKNYKELYSDEDFVIYERLNAESNQSQLGGILKVDNN